MDAGLVDVGCPHKGRGVTLQHKDALARRAAFLRRIQPIQPRTEDDFIPGRKGCVAGVGQCEKATRSFLHRAEAKRYLLNNPQLITCMHEFFDDLSRSPQYKGFSAENVDALRGLIMPLMTVLTEENGDA